MKHAVIVLALLTLSPAAFAEARGAVLFEQHCAACHQAKGEGTPGLAPRIAGTLGKRASSEAGRAYLAQLLIDGMAPDQIERGPRIPTLYGRAWVCLPASRAPRSLRLAS